MKPGDRISSIRRVAGALSEMQSADMDLALEEFGFQRSDPRDYDSSYDYAVYQLRRGGDESLAEIDAYLFPPDTGNGNDAVEDGPWKVGSFRLFISHTSANKERAGNLAKVLARYGVDAFVAHDTIEPTREWQAEIERALATCDALCAILTPDFVESRWSDQEVGFVVGRKKLIVPLKVGADPHGFIGKYQALSITDRDAGSVADKVLVTLVRSPLTAEAIAPAVVRRYARSGSFDATRSAFEMMQAIPPNAWTPEMIEQTERAASENTQVQHANVDDGTGRAIPAVVSEMLEPLRAEQEPASTVDDDIPF